MAYGTFDQTTERAAADLEEQSLEVTEQLQKWAESVEACVAIRSLVMAQLTTNSGDLNLHLAEAATKAFADHLPNLLSDMAMDMQALAELDGAA
ncbi:MAG: hypothetical protein AAF986_10115 [Pseudomonadota bacterium]